LILAYPQPESFNLASRGMPVASPNSQDQS
jgi:hypothetical protein